MTIHATAETEDTTALLTALGARVRARRKEMSISRRELSDLSGVSPRYLAQLESGAGNISVALLQRVAEALMVPIAALLAPAASDIASRYALADATTRAQVDALLPPVAPGLAKGQRICLIGLRGAGKSTLGAALAEGLGLPFVELNDEIEAEAGIPVSEIIALYGDEGYRALEADVLEKIVARDTPLVLAAAGGIVRDARAFDLVLSRFHTVWLRATPEDHMDRVRAQGDLRPMAGNPRAMEQLRLILSTREADYGRADHTLDTHGRSADISLADLHKVIMDSGALAGPERRTQ